MPVETVRKPQATCDSEGTLATNLFRVAANLEEALMIGKAIAVEIAGAPEAIAGPKDVRPNAFLDFGGYLVRLSDELLESVRTTQSNLGSVLNPKE